MASQLLWGEGTFTVDAGVITLSMEGDASPLLPTTIYAVKSCEDAERVYVVEDGVDELFTKY
jgi:hypothetical protein